jgi:hypothetical protein
VNAEKALKKAEADEEMEAGKVSYAKNKIEAANKEIQDQNSKISALMKKNEEQFIKK